MFELARAGVNGQASAVRKISNDFIRSVPTGVVDSEAFRRNLHEASSGSGPGGGVVFSATSLPTESDGDTALVIVDEFPHASPMVLPQPVQSQLDELLVEREKKKLLVSRGLSPTKTVLLSGPPGVGKTLAARWLAERLELPLVSLDLAVVMSSYLGTSGRNIKSVLNFGKAAPCVLLLDEFDALAKSRDDGSDVGELKRVVNILLVELDRWPDRSLLVAATNHMQLLDPAIERRFDRVIQMTLPGPAERVELIAEYSIESLDPGVVNAVAELTEGESPSGIQRILEQSARRSLVHDLPFERVVLTDLLSYAKSRGTARDAVWSKLHHVHGLSLRAIADLSGVSHPTVSQAVSRAEANARRN